MNWAVIQKSFVGDKIVQSFRTKREAENFLKVVRDTDVASARVYATPKVMWELKRRLRTRYRVVELREVA